MSVVHPVVAYTSTFMHRYCELYMTLCVRHHALLPGLMSAYATAAPAVQAALRTGSDALARALGHSNPQLLALVQDPLPGRMGPVWPVVVVVVVRWMAVGCSAVGKQVLSHARKRSLGMLQCTLLASGQSLSVFALLPVCCGDGALQHTFNAPPTRASGVLLLLAGSEPLVLHMLEVLMGALLPSQQMLAACRARYASTGNVAVLAPCVAALSKAEVLQLLPGLLQVGGGTGKQREGGWAAQDVGA